MKNTTPNQILISHKPKAIAAPQTSASIFFMSILYTTNLNKSIWLN